MHILLGFLAWTIISIIYFISRIGYKDPSRGIRKYVEYVICPPVLAIVSTYVGIRWIFKTPQPPRVSTGLCADLDIDGEGKKYYTQIQVFGEKGAYWYVNVYSDDKPITMTWPPPDNKE